jgi:hypothetical protein
MFHNMPADEWLETEGPRIIELCRKNNVLYSPVWAPPIKSRMGRSCRDLEFIGADMVELTRASARHLRRSVGGAECGAPLAMNPQKAYAVAKACSDAVKFPLSIKSRRSA